LTSLNKLCRFVFSTPTNCYTKLVMVWK
jgi:hypothetical protein